MPHQFHNLALMLLCDGGRFFFFNVNKCFFYFAALYPCNTCRKIGMSCHEHLAKREHRRKQKRKLADRLALAKHKLLRASAVPSLVKSSQLEDSTVAVQEFG